jgi:calcineurin-like phosphoesterase family protein
VDFFTSDQHFDHDRIIELCKRPFANADEMNEKMIANWNVVVKPEDTVHFLGDFAVGKTTSPEKAADYANKLNGSVEFCVGNHDEALLRAYERGMLERWIQRPLYYELKPTKKLTIVLCHYAMRNWQYRGYGSWHLFGHSHGGAPDLGKSTDVGVDRWSFAPVSLEQLKEYMSKKEIGNDSFY